MTRRKRTLKSRVSFSGIGLHTGEEISLHLCPAEEETGIVFQRIDLPNSPLIPATYDYVQETLRSTKIGIKEVSIQTIEHLLAALYVYRIDNLCIQVSGSEVPISDGSARSFCELIEKAGIVEQESYTEERSIEEPIFLSEGETHIVALPSDEYRISYTLNYPKTPKIGSQYFSCLIDEEHFKNELASARTFALYDELTYLKNQGLIRGGSLENAVVIRENEIVNKEGLRFKEEMVRHKILDMVGDLFLMGCHFNAHIIAIRTGHKNNVAFAKEMAAEMNKLNCCFH